MQPAQLSLLPDQVPIVIAQLPEAAVAEAVRILAGLITRTARPPAPAPAPGKRAGDE
jgi:hypothetical protein